MLTLNEISNVSFRKARRSGYQPEDVDEFIDKVAESYDLLIKKNIEQKEQNEALTAENERLRNSLESMSTEQRQQPAVAAQQNDEPLSEECEYTQEEIKNALLSAQKLANATIREARQKAEAMINEANAKAERIVTVAQGEVDEQKAELERLKRLVSDFRASLLDKYKEHLKLVNALPTQRSMASIGVEEPTKAVNLPKKKVQKEATAQPAAPAAAPAPKKPEVQECAGPNLSRTEGKEEMSKTQSFHLGKLDETGEFSELKFGADYDISKD